jgi:hypothetical protein
MKMATPAIRQNEAVGSVNKWVAPDRIHEM